MKLLSLIALAVSLVCLSYGQAPSESYHALITRSTSGRVLDERGLASGVMPLSKGGDYNVVEQKVGYLVISVGGKNVSVPPGDASVSKGSVPVRTAPATPPAIVMPTRLEAPASVPVTPGTIELISAKYTLLGNQPRNVKTKLAKLIPAGVIDKSVNILVSDNLSTAAAAQGNTFIVRTGQYSSVTKEHPKNILTVEYRFNGQVWIKEAIEGSYMSLP